MNSTAKNKIFLQLLFILLTINFLYSCKKSTDNLRTESKDKIRNQANEYKEIKDFHIKSDYTINPVKELVINFIDYDFEIKYIDDRAYIRYAIKDKIIQDWQSFNINFYYDNSYEEAEKNIHILYNSELAEGILMTPSFTEEFPSYFIYKFNSKHVQFIKDIELNNSQNKTIGLEGHFQAIQQQKLTFNFVTPDKAVHKYIDRNFAPEINNMHSKKDLELIRGKKTDNEIAGLWQLDCSINNSGIEIYTDGKTITGSLALAPPAIFLDVILEKGENENTYYLKYLSQDMDPPLASENEIDEENSSKSENIGKIVRQENNLEFTWYGIYNTKMKKRTNVISQFNESETLKSAVLKRCNYN